MTAPWTDAELDDLARDYPADTHADVAALIAGARAVVALHVDNGEYDSPRCAECRCDVCGDSHVRLPCRTVRALSLEESP